MAFSNRVARPSHLVTALCVLVGLYLIWRRMAELGSGSPAYQLKYSSLEVTVQNDRDAGAARSIRPSFSRWFATEPTKAVVMGKLSTEDTTWTAELSPQWQTYVYVVNDTTAPLHTARNRGREANAYLTYLIDHYHHLPDTIVFIHSHRKGYPQAWHTEGRDHDILDSLRRLNASHVQHEGYANLRCNLEPGCSAGGRIQPFRHVNGTRPLPLDEAAEVAWIETWPELFPGSPMPEEIAVPCCAQFAVSKSAVRRRPLADYRRFHEWLMETRLTDEVSGRIMEYAWHILFGKGVVHCPNPATCGTLLYYSDMAVPPTVLGS